MSQHPKNLHAPAIHRGASRRLFLHQAGALSCLAGAGAPLALNLLAAGSATAQVANDYRAIVCLFMFGGNDAFNTVLPTDPASWQAYEATRKQSESIALRPLGTPPNASAGTASPDRLGGVIDIRPTNAQGRTFALHPSLGPLQSLFNVDKRLAVLANVGPLLMPTTKQQYGQGSHPKPPRLFSHNDQQSTWQSMAPEGATQGWGGQMADLLMGSNQQAVFTSISAAGSAVWLSGQEVRQYQVGSGGALRMGAGSDGRLYNSEAAAAALTRFAASAQGKNPLEHDVARIARRSIDAELALRNAMRPAGAFPFGTAPATGPYNPSADPLLAYKNPFTGVGVFNSVAQQLQVVARLIDAGRAGKTGVKRQVFFVSLGGFDTHDDQISRHPELLAKVAHGMSYFDTVLGHIGAQDAVTSFTASDFGRTFTSNGDGTDHGWGAHQFVMGGAVRGGDLYGRFPQLAARNPNNNEYDASPDQLSRSGSLLPSTSVDQLGATLGRWFGLSDGQVLSVFPNLRNFDAGVRNLGFMR